MILPVLLMTCLPLDAAAEISAFEQLLKSAPAAAVSSAKDSLAAAPIKSGPADERHAIEGIGLSHSGDPHDIPDFTPSQMAKLMREGGSTHYRPHLPLNETLPILTYADLEELRLAENDPVRMDAMIERLLVEGNWEKMDALVDAFVAENIKLILVVGAGYRKEAPFYKAADGKMKRVSPDRLSHGTYLALVRWIVGAQVRRYGDRVKYWQIENEINAALSTLMVNWRVRELSWGNKKFLIELLQVLGDTVHEEGRRMGRDLKTTHNFLAGIPWASYKKFVEKGTENDSAGIFSSGKRNFLDVVGIDSYLNYYQGFPLLDKVVGGHVRQAKKLAKGRPVWVLETGIASDPWHRGFSDRRQGKYFKKTFEEAYKSGASMVLAFGWFWNPRGWYNDRTDELPWWHPQAVEQYWSPIRVETDETGARTIRFSHAWDELRKAAHRWLPSKR